MKYMTGINVSEDIPKEFRGFLPELNLKARGADLVTEGSLAGYYFLNIIEKDGARYRYVFEPVRSCSEVRYSLRNRFPLPDPEEAAV